MRVRLSMFLILFVLSVSACHQDPALEAASRVFKVISPDAAAPILLYTGRLDNGYVVITDKDEIFWVFDDQVFAVNDTAIHAASEIPMSNPRISEERARKAVATENNNEPHAVAMPVPPCPDNDYIAHRFEQKRDYIMANSAPKDTGELLNWYPSPTREENAAVLYERALKTWTSSRKLNLLLEAADMRHSRFPSRWNETINGIASYDLIDPDSLMGIRNLAKFLESTAADNTLEGDCQKAIQAVSGIFGMVRHMANSPFLTMQLNRYYCSEVATRALHNLLNSCILEDEDLRNLDVVIQSANCQDALVQAWFAERILYDSQDPFLGTPEKFYVAEAQHHWRIMLNRIRIAQERFVQLHFQWPKRIEDLVPVFLEHIPIDPMTGNTMDLQKVQ